MKGSSPKDSTTKSGNEGAREKRRRLESVRETEFEAVETLYWPRRDVGNLSKQKRTGGGVTT